MLPLETALKTLEYLDEEDEYVPWMAASDEVDYIDKMISGEDMNDIFKVILRHISHFLSHTL